MCIGYDPFKWADNYNCELTQLIEDKVLDFSGLAELYDEGLITKEEFEDGKELLLCQTN